MTAIRNPMVKLFAAIVYVFSSTWVASAAYAQYRESCGFILDPPVIPVGGEIHIIGSGFGPNRIVRFVIAPADNPNQQVTLGVTRSDNDPDGNIDATFPLPPQFDKDGQFIITVRCPDGAIASNVLIVGRGFQTTTTTTAQLPVTGSDLPLLLVRIAAILLALGGMALLYSKRGGERESVRA